MPSPCAKTTPPATAGPESMTKFAVPVKSGWHVFGVPEQFVTPSASNAYNVPACVPMYNTPPATAGDEEFFGRIGGGVNAFHSGLHTFGVPEQPVTPAASIATTPSWSLA